MKLLPKDWPSDKTSHAVGFFAQSALELVHDMSWESYKLPALSPLWRLIELRRVSQQVMRGILPAKALEPIIDELNDSLSSDPIIASMLEMRKADVSDLTISKLDKPHDIYSQCGFILDMCRKDYRSKSENVIVDEVMGAGRKSIIYLMLKNYLSDLRLQGHSNRSIEQAARDTFFAPGIKPGRGVVRRFFRKFPKENVTFYTYGVASENLIEALGRIGVVQKVSGRKVPRKISSKVKPLENESHFWIESEARDVYSAALRSGRILDFSEAVLSIFPGKPLGKLPEECYVTKRGASEYTLAPIKSNFSKRILSYSANSAFAHMERVGTLLTKNRKTDSIVGSNLLRATATAALADKSSAAEVKLLTLWAAFEALLPIVPDGVGNRISHFLEYIVPAVTISYARECFIEFSRDASRLHSSAYKEAISKIEHDTDELGKLAFLVVKGSKDQKLEFCSHFLSNPMALYRLKVLEEKFSKPNRFEVAVNSHYNRVSWQVQRIYRERNAVMHNGESSPFVDQLLSNTHHYYLSTFSNIEMISKSYGGLSVSHALSAIRKLKQADSAKLSRAKSGFKSDPSLSEGILLDLISGHFFHPEF